MAQRAGISLATYSKIENGHQGVSLSKFLAALRALGLLQKIETALDPYESDLGRARRSAAPQEGAPMTTLYVYDGSNAADQCCRATGG